MTWTTRLLQRPTPTTRVSSPYPWCTGAPVVCLHRRSQAYTARGLLLRGCITRRCRHDFATPIGQVVPPPPLLLPPHIIHVAWIPSFGASPIRVGQAGFVAQHNQTRAAHKFPTAPSARTDVNLYTSTAALTNSIDWTTHRDAGSVVVKFSGEVCADPHIGSPIRDHHPERPEHYVFDPQTSFGLLGSVGSLLQSLPPLCTYTCGEGIFAATSLATPLGSSQVVAA